MDPREKYAQMAFLRANQITWNRSKTNAPLLPISRTNFLEGVKAGKYPQPVRMGKVAMWPTEEIFALIDTLKSGRAA